MDDGLGEIQRSATLAEQVYDRLRRGLLRGQYKPGEKITARRLARTLGVSPTPAREALTRLASEGAIEISETRSFLVPRLTRQRYLEISEIRKLLEPHAALLAAPKGGAVFAARLDKLNERMKAGNLSEDFDAALELDSEFHLMFYARAASPVLTRMIDVLWLQVGPMRTLLPHVFRKSLTGYRNHLAVIEAVRARDPQGASNAIQKDLSDGIEGLLAALDP
ncbi:GntR family transcriptional regulator [Pikeienuella piscinae]|uniref:GntR family transcriptional regulator n=1 Tax=Pikeienuella piscinae TaxID=2748098 RepID=A0A7L5BZH6_9RHOB|nr:GntR family transcriptional regulator [Pikeienuella piscinae]QIE55927.1 GntR family transcriptional regulator [Pikeienuella piscinae]